MVNFKQGAKQPKEQKLLLHFINLKIVSDSRTSKEAIPELLSKLKKSRLFIKTYGDKGLRIRTLKSEVNGEIITGKLLYTTKIISDTWYDEETDQFEDIGFDKKRFEANPKETYFYFVPEAHRFALVADKGVSLNSVIKFLDQGLNQVAEDDEEVQVIIEQSSDGYDLIFNAKEIKKLTVFVTASNNDLTDMMKAKQLDDNMKNAFIDDLNLEVNHKSKSPIKVEESDLLVAAISLAQSNGSVVASIRDENNKIRRVNTTMYPRKERVIGQSGFEFHAVLSKIMSIFRPNNE